MSMLATSIDAISTRRSSSASGDQFTRAIYPIGHPNRQPDPEELLAAAESAKVGDAKAFHAKYYGPAHFTLVAVGDLDVPQLQAELGKSFAGWTGGSDVIHPAKATATDAAKSSPFPRPLNLRTQFLAPVAPS